MKEESEQNTGTNEIGVRRSRNSRRKESTMSRQGRKGGGKKIQ